MDSMPQDSCNPSLTVRRLHIDLSQPFDRHWNGQDAFRSAFANALSFSFPAGEQFFIDSMKRALPLLKPLPNSKSLFQDAKSFIGQEGTHRFLHAQFNEQLARQGYRNRWEGRIKRHIIRLERDIKKHSAPRHLHELAVTCAVEHLTAIMGDTVMALKDGPQDWFADAQEPVRRMWYWHCAEEAEHKALAFDVYTALGGDRKLRMFYFRRILVLFVIDMTLQIADNLWRDGSWKLVSTWKKAATFLFGRRGVLPLIWKDLCAYGREGFHPNLLGQIEPSQAWISQNQFLWTAVKRDPKP